MLISKYKNCKNKAAINVHVKHDIYTNRILLPPQIQLNINSIKKVAGVAQVNVGQKAKSAYIKRNTNVIVAKNQVDKQLNKVIMALFNEYFLFFIIYSFFSL